MLTSIKIVGKPYRIIKGTKEGLLGECNNTLLEISYEPEQARLQLADTVLHEALHAIDYAVQAKLTERQVHSLSTALLSLLRDNPKLVKFLTE